MLDIFVLTHSQTDFLLSYPDEIKFTLEEEAEYMQKKADSENEVEIMALVDGKVVGSAGVDSVGKAYKLKFRSNFGISVDKAYWGLGIGSALTEACIECAKKAGYKQIELDAVTANERAIALYKKFGYIEYGRNPKGFFSRDNGWQTVVLMRKELD